MPRSGETVITSVSISKEFRDLCNSYNISPTDALRKGVAVELYERGISSYLTKLNEERYNNIQALLTSWEKLVELTENKVLLKLLESKKEIEELIKFFEQKK